MLTVDCNKTHSHNILIKVITAYIISLQHETIQAQVQILQNLHTLFTRTDTIPSEKKKKGKEFA